MIAKVSQSGHTTYGLLEYVIDTPADINKLPLDVPMGSSALCLDTCDVYVLNGNKEWTNILDDNNSDSPSDDSEGD